MRKRIHLVPPKPVENAAPVEPKYVGLWIDHAKAHIVIVQGEDVTMESVYSTAPARYRSTGGRSHGSPYANDSIVSEKNKENRRELELKRFYRHLADLIGDAEEVLLTGPGEAKHEFRREFIRHAPLSKRLAEVHTDDRMTARQLRAKVKRFFEGRGKITAAKRGTVIAV